MNVSRIPLDSCAFVWNLHGFPENSYRFLYESIGIRVDAYWVPIGLLWILMDSYGFLWIPMDSYAISMDSYELLCIPMASYRIPIEFLGVPRGFLFIAIDSCGVCLESYRISMDSYRVCMDFSIEFLWIPMASYGIL